jgi:hypothetical protein
MKRAGKRFAPSGASWLRSRMVYHVNLHDTDARDKGADSNYGANFTRLATLKKPFDPMNLFHLNANIKPA